MGRPGVVRLSKESGRISEDQGNAPRLADSLGHEYFAHVSQRTKTHH